MSGGNARWLHCSAGGGVVAREKSVEAYMPLWISDYLGDTTRLTYPLHGAYLLLLMTSWREGGALPDNDDELAAIIGASVKEWRKDVRPRLERFFRIADGIWRHKRVDEELARAKAIRAKKAEAGLKGAQNRWQSDGTAIADAMANASQNDAISPSPTPVEANASTQEAPRRRKGDASHDLPSDWVPDDLHQAKAAKLGVDCDEQADRMRNWAAAGGHRCKNWNARFHLWLQRSVEMNNGGKPSNRTQASGQSLRDIQLAAALASCRD
jgi:uncharacterized protein YdaU (DUF1376 family)